MTEVRDVPQPPEETRNRGPARMAARQQAIRERGGGSGAGQMPDVDPETATGTLLTHYRRELDALRNSDDHTPEKRERLINELKLEADDTFRRALDASKATLQARYDDLFQRAHGHEVADWSGDMYTSQAALLREMKMQNTRADLERRMPKMGDAGMLALVERYRKLNHPAIELVEDLAEDNLSVNNRGQFSADLERVREDRLPEGVKAARKKLAEHEALEKRLERAWPTQQYLLDQLTQGASRRVEGRR